MKKIATLLIIVFLIGCKPAEMQQERLLSGVVTTDYGEAAFGAIVSVKGTQRGVQADVYGKYAIPVKKGETLVFSYVGFNTYEIKVENQPTLNIKLESAPTLSAVIDDPVRSDRNQLADYTIVTKKQIEENPSGMFQKDLKENHLKIYMLGGFAPATRPEDKPFGEKYSVQIHDFGCVAPQNISTYTKYNILVFKHLKKKFGDGWESEINPKVLGWQDWKKK